MDESKAVPTVGNRKNYTGTIEARLPKCDFSKSVRIRAVCPHCRQRMLLTVGLSPETGENVIQCVRCGRNLVALVPGPVIGRPWKA